MLLKVTGASTLTDDVVISENECFIGKYRLIPESPEIIYYWNERIIDQDACMHGLMANVI